VKTASIQLTGVGPVAKFIDRVIEVAQSSDTNRKTADQLWSALGELAGKSRDDT
jgi:hypothetical protein